MKVVDKLGMPLSGVRRSAFNLLNERVYNGSYRLVKIDQCFCGSREFKSLSRYDRFGLPFGTQMCTGCGLIALDKMLSENDLPSFYNDIYWPLVAGGTKIIHYDTSGFEAFIEPYINDDVKVVMEIGCGDGKKLELVRKLINQKGVRLIGSDFSEQALQVAKTKGIEVLMGGLEILKTAGKADILILSHVFEHLPNLRKALQDISDLIHPKSKIYVEVPGVIDLENKKEYGFAYFEYCVLAHIHNFSLTTLANVFKAGGFGLIRGDEFVRAVFSLSVANPQIVRENPCKQIVDSLSRAQVNSEKHNRSFLRRVKRALSVAKKEWFEL